jgi:probable rRNA maturation factor
MHEILIDIAVEPEGLENAASFSALAEAAIRKAVGTFAPIGEYEVSVLITDDAGIRKLNSDYRGKDTHTDVLSFPQLEGEDSDFSPGMAALLGDIVISMETAARQAAEFGHPLEREMAFLAVHGALHLLGYDHEEAADKAEMRLAEETVLAGIGLQRV